MFPSSIRVWKAALSLHGFVFFFILFLEAVVVLEKIDGAPAEQEIDEFWATIIGPAEYLRSKIRESLFGIVKDWKTITYEDNETLTIRYKNGT